MMAKSMKSLELHYPTILQVFYNYTYSTQSSIEDEGASTTQISVARHPTLKNGPNADQCSHTSYAENNVR